MLNLSYEHSNTFTRLQNQFFSLESILADSKESPSLPPSPVSPLSSVIASPQLNPLYYSHVSAFIPLCPSSCRAFFCGGAFRVAPCLRPSLSSSPSAPTPTSILRVTQSALYGTSPGLIYEGLPSVDTHIRKQTSSWYISNLAPCAGTARCWTIV